jgi:hypothetical protein
MTAIAFVFTVNNFKTEIPHLLINYSVFHDANSYV